MAIYAFIYSLTAILSIIGGGRIFSIQRNVSGFFFLLFTIAASIWLLIYYLFFANILGEDLLLLLSRIAFALSIIGEYSLILYIWNFHKGNTAQARRNSVYILCIFVILSIFYIFTGGIVNSLVFDAEANTFREIYGPLVLIHSILTIGFIPLLITASTIRIREQNSLNKVRLKMIALSVGVLMGTLIFLQFILPMFDIWIFEKEVSLLFVLFVASIVYITKRYYFSGIGFGIGKIIIYGCVFLLTVLILNIARFIFGQGTGLSLGYWIDKDIYSFIEVFISIASFLILERFFSRIFLSVTSRATELKMRINSLSEDMSGITRENELSQFLSNRVKQIFKTSLFEIRKSDGTYSELENFFNTYPKEKAFINDMVFIEENGKKFNKSVMNMELNRDQFIALPISGMWNGLPNCYGVILLGQKSFGDFYDTEEISALIGLSFSVGRQLKYIDMYDKIRDLSENLDKKVDEKTIEYNDLLNRQKEFISVISHEIKAPIANAIFQADSIIYDLEDASFPIETLKQELSLLNKELIKTGELTTKLFSVQYFDTRSVALFRERIQLSQLLRTEYEVYSRMYEQVHFINLIDEDMGFVKIDKIQFQQVITNLLQNAVKFLDKKDSIILIEAYKKKGVLSVTIEDNGRGFQGMNVESLFDRYTTGSGELLGLGMGLYLCKKIIDMHGGTITASTGEKLGGAKFSIKIPLN
ncbi:TPA: hypothetical protein DCZ36_03290 [Candidatus Gracilibacteria bacterium]|nr:hypothetical protein [Candidatus Gracilibacteria bacterium]